MHNDSCTSDNWSNYHHRLNRRYDSGYKSVENQLSSSLENNIAAVTVAPSAPQRARPAAATGEQSECRDAFAESKDQKSKQENDGADDDKGVASMDIASPSDRTPVNESSPDPMNIDGKLAELELDNPAGGCLVNEPLERECQSRNSSKGSSGEEDKKREYDTGWPP